MNTFQKVKALLELNTLRGVGVKVKDGRWKVFTHINGDGKLCGTYEDITIGDTYCPYY